MALELLYSGLKILESKGVLHWGGSFLFGALGYGVFTGLPLVYGTAIGTYIETEATFLFLMSSAIAVLTASFLFLSSVQLSEFLVYSIIGALTTHAPIWLQFGPSPVLPMMFFTFIGSLILGSALFAIYTYYKA